MKYKIVINYRTGDSFRSEDTSTEVDYYWDTFEKAKENLQRIKEHYQMYASYNRNYDVSFNVLKKNFGHKDWFVEAKGDDNFKATIAGLSLTLYDDYGKPFRQSCPWAGYFETLYGGSVIIVNDTAEFFYDIVDNKVKDL